MDLGTDILKELVSCTEGMAECLVGLNGSGGCHRGNWVVPVPCIGELTFSAIEIGKPLVCGLPW